MIFTQLGLFPVRNTARWERVGLGRIRNDLLVLFVLVAYGISARISSLVGLIFEGAIRAVMLCLAAVQL